MKTTLCQLLIGALALSGALAVAQDQQKEAPAFELKDSTGKTHDLSSYAEKIVVLEWTNKDCPYVVRHYRASTMQDLARSLGQEGVVWLAVDSTKNRDPVSVEEWRKRHRIDHPVLLDPTGDTGRAYGAKTTPHIFVIHDGKVVYDGAIDDSQRGDAKVNYAEKAVKEVLAGKAVSTPHTKSYGCSVKYAKARPKADVGHAWLESYEKAQALAKQTGRPILADFTGSDWCGWCIKLKKEVFDTDEFKKWASSNVILLELDFPRRKQQSEELAEQNKALRDKFGIRGYPTIVFMDANGKELGRSGYKPGGPEAWIPDAEQKLK